MTELYKSNTFASMVVVSFLNASQGKANIRVVNNFPNRVLQLFVFLR